jgi:predicted RNase H-like HicB family nuclease
MTTTELVVTSQAATPTVAVPLLAGAAASQRLEFQVWTAVSVTELPMADQPTGALTLVVLEGVNRALSVRIHEDADGVAVADAETGVFGAGGSLREAVLDLRSALQDHLEVLTEDDALSPGLQHQLEVLRSYFTNP